MQRCNPLDRPPQVLSVQASIRCLSWNQKQRILGMGQVPAPHGTGAMQFFTIDAEDVLAYRRIKQREISTSAIPNPVWLKGDESRFVGSRKYAATVAKKDTNKPDWHILKLRYLLLVKSKVESRSQWHFCTQFRRIHLLMQCLGDGLSHLCRDKTPADAGTISYSDSTRFASCWMQPSRCSNCHLHH